MLERSHSRYLLLPVFCPLFWAVHVGANGSNVITTVVMADNKATSQRYNGGHGDQPIVTGRLGR